MPPVRYGIASSFNSTGDFTESCYDLNGNLLNDGTRGFDYDDENQLIRVTATNAWKTEFTYDGKMRRRIVKEFTWNGSSWTQTNEVHFIYDGNLVVQERDANNLPTVTYTRGNDLSGRLQGAGGIGGLLARTENAKLIIGDSFASAYYHADGNGNVTCLINSLQQLAAKYLYDPYGNMLSMYGSLADANTYRFSSKEWNANSGLYYYLYRFYDSSLQRWVNREPLADESIVRQVEKNPGSPYAWFLRHEAFENLYKLNHNNPNYFVDKDGRFTLVLTPVAIGVIVAGGILAICEMTPACRNALSNTLRSIADSLTRSVPCPNNQPQMEETCNLANAVEGYCI